MKVRTRVAVLAAYIFVVGALLAAEPSPVVAQTEGGCYIGWIECLEALSMEHCGGIGYCDTGYPCGTSEYHTVCKGDA